MLTYNDKEFFGYSGQLEILFEGDRFDRMILQANNVDVLNLDDYENIKKAVIKEYPIKNV